MRYSILFWLGLIMSFLLCMAVINYEYLFHWQKGFPTDLLPIPAFVMDFIMLIICKNIFMRIAFARRKPQKIMFYVLFIIHGTLNPLCDAGCDSLEWFYGSHYTLGLFSQGIKGLMFDVTVVKMCHLNRSWF